MAGAKGIISVHITKPESIINIILTYQISKLLSKSFIKLPEYFSSFINIFNKSKANKLLKQGGVKHFINTINPPLYKPLYNLFKFQLKALKLYLVNAIKKRQIRLFINPARAFILFILKKDSKLYFYINYYSLNKVIIKN